MRKIKEVLRLHSLGLNQHQIARSCTISQSTGHAYLTAAEPAGVHWPLPPDWDDRKLEEILFGRPGAPKLPRRHPLPDFASIHEQMQKHKHVTLHLLWQEYREP